MGFPETAARRVTRDRASGTTTVTNDSDTGTATHPEYGIAFRDVRRSDYTITRGDPLSYHAREVCMNERTRDGVLSRVTATGTLRATETDWIIEARIEAETETGQDTETVFTRAWSKTIARDHM